MNWVVMALGRETIKLFKEVNVVLREDIYQAASGGNGATAQTGATLAMLVHCVTMAP